jgi:hypothetical protein
MLLLIAMAYASVYVGAGFSADASGLCTIGLQRS